MYKKLMLLLLALLCLGAALSEGNALLPLPGNSSPP